MSCCVGSSGRVCIMRMRIDRICQRARVFAGGHRHVTSNSGEPAGRRPSNNRITSYGLLVVPALCWSFAAAAGDAAPTDDTGVELWAIHGQSTYTQQYQPAFRSPYQGPQSLSPAANGRETFDATIYAG